MDIKFQMYNLDKISIIADPAVYRWLALQSHGRTSKHKMKHVRNSGHVLSNVLWSQRSFTIGKSQ